MARLTIDGRAVEVEDGATVLDAAHVAGIDVPTRCADPRLAPVGACRLCVVEVDGHARPEAACTTPATSGMVVSTATPRLERLRADLLTLMDAGPPGTEAELVDDSHLLIHVDLTQCISCWRCVRICDEVEGRSVWRIEGRGPSSRIVPDSGTTFGSSSCVSCGACVDTCPTDALVDRHLVGVPTPTEWTRTTCPYCGVGCELEMATADGAVVAARPALDAPVNRGHACVKGRYGFGFAAADDRVTAPMIRDADGWRETTWDEALAVSADRLRAVIDRDGPDAVGVLASARATNEDNYLWQKLSRVAIGTNNVDGCARVCHAPSAAGLKAVLGTGAATSSFDDIELARTILVCGSNTTENHPVVGSRILAAARRGASLVVIDPRRIDLVDAAVLHLRPRPGTTIALLAAMASTIVEEGLVDAAFVDARTEQFDEYAAASRGWRPEWAAPICGVGADDIRAAARLYATGGPSIAFWGLGLTEHHQGTDGVMCMANLALLTGNLGRPGTGVNPLRGQNNVQGAAHMGCEPHHLPGYVPLDDGAAAATELWGRPVPTTRGLDAMEMIDAAGDAVRAMVVAGWDVALTQPDLHTTRRRLGGLETLVVVDLFLNETARRFAHVFLPAASAFEKEGTFMNSERRVQRIRPLAAPPGAVRPDWKIASDLAGALGHGDGFRHADARAVWDEIRRIWAPGAGITNRRLDEPGGVQWPCPSEDHPGTVRLHTEAFPGIGPRARLRPIEFRPSPEHAHVGDDRPFRLVTGRGLYQFNAGTMTGRSLVHELRPTDTLEIHPADADAYGVADGRPVRIVSRYGEAVLPAEVTDRVDRGVLFCTFNDPTTEVNLVTGPHRDPVTHTPEYKLTAVRIEAVTP